MTAYEINWDDNFLPLYGHSIMIPANTILWRGYDPKYEPISERPAYYGSKVFAQGYAEKYGTNASPFIISRPLHLLDIRFMKVLLSQLFEHNLKEYDDYDIIKEIDKRITAAVYVHNADQLNQAMKQQERKLLYDGCKLTVDEFKHEYLKFVSANSLSNQSAVSLLDFIKKLLPDSNLLPSSININVNDVQHQKPDAANCNSVIEFENCNCGQTIYVAKNKDLNQCPICRFGRYSNNKDKRYPISLMNYRSIIMILYQLLQTNEFYNTIQNVKYKDTRNHFYSR
jgi:hypothetical protein